jgi:hypothetical protein
VAHCHCWCSRSQDTLPCLFSLAVWCCGMSPQELACGVFDLHGADAVAAADKAARGDLQTAARPCGQALGISGSVESDSSSDGGERSERGSMPGGDKAPTSSRLPSKALGQLSSGQLRLTSRKRSATARSPLIQEL